MPVDEVHLEIFISQLIIKWDSVLHLGWDELKQRMVCTQVRKYYVHSSTHSLRLHGDNQKEHTYHLWRKTCFISCQNSKQSVPGSWFSFCPSFQKKMCYFFNLYSKCSQETIQSFNTLQLVGTHRTRCYPLVAFCFLDCCRSVLSCWRNSSCPQAVGV